MDWTERLNKRDRAITIGDGHVEILTWYRQANLPDNQPHTHTFFEVCQVGRWGRGTFTANGIDHAIGVGDVFIARPGVVHQIRNAESPHMDLRWVAFQWVGKSGRGEMDRLMREFADSPRVISHDADRRVAAVWDALSALAEARPKLGYEAQETALLTALILAIAQSGIAAGEIADTDTGSGRAADVTARTAVRYIHDNLNRPLSLSEIAAHVAVSPRHLTRMFTRFVGSSPATYVLRARLDRAAGMLVHGSEPIKEIARIVGIADVHHFTRVFTRHYGMPPGEYRRQGVGAYVPNRQNVGLLI